MNLFQAIRHSFSSQSMYFHGILLTLALKHGDRSKVFYSQKTGTAVLQFYRTIGCPKSQWSVWSVKIFQSNILAYVHGQCPRTGPDAVSQLPDE